MSEIDPAGDNWDEETSPDSTENNDTYDDGELFNDYGIDNCADELEDVTGGMTRKITEAVKMSKYGLKVFFVNGNKPQRIIGAVSGKKFEGTLFR